MIRLGITGTDTSVGKTVVTAALVAWLKDHHLDVAAMKPVETGGGDDATILHRAAQCAGAMADVCPVRFAEPLSPFAAASAQGSAIDIEELDAAFLRLSSGRDGIIVEGAGGLLVPITQTMWYAHLFERWNLSIIIVAADRLGVLNHVLLTAMAALDRKLEIKGIVLNSVPVMDDRADPSRRSNQERLQELLPRVPVIRFSQLTDPQNLSLLIKEAETSGLGLLAVGSGDRSSHRLPSTSAVHRS